MEKFLDHCVSGRARDNIQSLYCKHINSIQLTSFSCSFQGDSTKVLARFDLDKTWREFVFFFGIPSVLFVVSFITLLIITRSVKVGDDAKMRCKCCTDENSDIDDIDEIANKCVQQLNAIEEAVNEQEQIDQPCSSKVRNHIRSDLST